MAEQAWPRPFTDLHHAALSGDLELMSECLAAGDDINCLSYAEDGFAATPICLAVVGCHTLVVKALIQAKADVSLSSPSNGVSPMQLAVEKNAIDIVSMLLAARADANQANHSGAAALHFAACGHEELVKLLISAGANINKADREGSTPLIDAAKGGHWKCVRILLEAGADISKPLNDGITALHLSAGAGHEEITELLLSGGAASCINAWSSLGSPLMCAALRGFSRIVRVLIEAGADPNAIREDGMKVLHLALLTNLETVQVLLAGGASATTLHPISRYSFLHFAGIRGVNEGIIRALYQAGADPTLKDRWNQSASYLAREAGHENTAKLLDKLALEYITKQVHKEYKETGTCKKGPMPCFHCLVPTSTICSRCKTVYLCSVECQKASYAVHKPICLFIFKENKKEQK